MDGVCPIPTPVIEGDILCDARNNISGKCRVFRLPKSLEDVSLEHLSYISYGKGRLDMYKAGWRCASPLLHKGLLYIVGPLLVGKYIYVFGFTGTTVVFEPGTQYKEVARNKIETIVPDNRYARKLIRPEEFKSAPVVDGDRIYVRGEKNVYCIGKK